MRHILPVTITAVLALVLVMTLHMSSDEGAAYPFDGVVEEGQSVWFNITVIDVEDALVIDYSTSEWYDEVALYLFFEDGTWRAMNTSDRQSLYYSRYSSIEFEPGTYSLAVMGIEKRYGVNITFFGTCNYPIEPVPMHSFGGEGLRGQELTFEVEVEDTTQDLWLSVFWSTHEVDYTQIMFMDTTGRMIINENGFGHAYVIERALSTAGTYTLDVRLTATYGSGFKQVFGASNMPVTYVGKSPGIDVYEPSRGMTFDGIGDTMEIRWVTDGDIGDEVKISLDGPYHYMDEVIAEATSNDGEFEWTIEGDLETEDFQIVVTSVQDPSISGRSDYFEIVVETIQVLSPEEGSVFELGSVMRIEWDVLGVAGDYVEITLAHRTTTTGWLPGGWVHGQVVHDRTIKETTPNDGSYDWTIPDDVDERDDYCIVIESTEDSEIMGTSGSFEITERRPVFPGPSEVEWFYEGTIDRNDDYYFELEVEDTDTPLWVMVQWDNWSVGLSMSLRSAEGTLYDYDYDWGDGYRQMTWRLEEKGLHIMELYKYTGPVGRNGFNISSNRTMEPIEPEGGTTTGSLEVGSIPFFEFDCPGDDAVIMYDVSYVNASARLMAILVNPVGDVRWYDWTDDGNLTWCSFLDMKGVYTFCIYISDDEEWTGGPIEYTMRCNHALEETGSRRESTIRTGETHFYSIEVTDYDVPIIVLASISDPNASTEVSLIGPRGNVLKHFRSPSFLTYVPSARGTYKVRIHLEGADDNETTYNITSNLDLDPSSAPLATVPGWLCLGGLFGGLVVLVGMMVMGRGRRKGTGPSPAPVTPPEEAPVQAGGPEPPEGSASGMSPQGEDRPVSEPGPPGEEPEPEVAPPGEGEGPSVEEEGPPGREVGSVPACLQCGYEFKADDARFCPVCGIPRGEGSG